MFSKAIWVLYNARMPANVLRACFNEIIYGLNEFCAAHQMDCDFKFGIFDMANNSGGVQRYQRALIDSHLVSIFETHIRRILSTVD